MQPRKAHVKNCRLLLDEPTDLPESTEEYDRISDQALDLFLSAPGQAIALLTPLRRRLLRCGDRSRAAACLFLMLSAAQIMSDADTELRIARRLSNELPSLRTFHLLAKALWRLGRFRAAATAFRRAHAVATSSEIGTPEYAELTDGLAKCEQHVPTRPLWRSS